MKLSLQPTGDVTYNSLSVKCFAHLNEFRGRFYGDCLSTAYSFSINESMTEIVAKLRRIAPDLTCDFFDRRNVVMDNAEVCIQVNDTIHAYSEPWGVTKRDLTIRAWGAEAVLRQIGAMVADLPKLKAPRVTWNYMAGGNRQEAVVFVEEPSPTHDAFYPWMKGGVEAYIREYIASTASILLLRGPPGGGKTSFIRKMIWEADLNAIITYEDNLFQSDELFVNFLTSDESDLLIMEDADVMLASRERDGNPLMAKFLNVADGLIRFPKKKIVISSNIQNERDIDEALLRPGRCFDTPVFRLLTHAEAVAAAEAAGVEAPSGAVDYSLAEVLKGKRTRSPDLVGFLGGRAAA